jgi:sodium transport system ATP-binding protein
MGANGAGKSTLLKCLAGAVRPSTGQVRWFGNSVARSLPVRRRIGFVGHELGLYSELTALENLLFVGRMCGLESARDRAWELLATIGLEPQADRLVGQLSQGMRRRLAIARALVHEPLLILLDEPFVSLDADGRSSLERLFKQWQCAGRAVCFASHNARQSHILADRIVRLDAGRIVANERITVRSTHSLRSA